MKFLKELLQYDRFKLEGAIRCVLSTIPRALLFALVTTLWIELRINIEPREPLEDVAYGFLLVSLAGLIFSFVPASIGGWVLVFWIRLRAATLTLHHGILSGCLAGIFFMLGFDFFIGILFSGSNHAPSVEAFLFYAVISTIVAALMGAWVGLQLTNKALKNNFANE